MNGLAPTMMPSEAVIRSGPEIVGGTPVFRTPIGLFAVTDRSYASKAEGLADVFGRRLPAPHAGHRAPLAPCRRRRE